MFYALQVNLRNKMRWESKLTPVSKKVKEIQEYIRRRKNLTAGQIELILRKNKIVIPKDFQTYGY